MTSEKRLKVDIENDIANLARLAAAESYDDVRLFLAKLVRKYRIQNPDLALQLESTLKSSQTRSSGNAILRRGSDNHESRMPTGVPVDGESRMALIKVFDDLAGMEAPLLPGPLSKRIDGIIRERMERERLIQRGISPTRSAILVGPPGVGKTLTARWIARSVGKPLWVLDLTAVMSSLLGKTGNNLRQALDHAKEHGAVLLLDEIDSIAKRRSDESDVGELKRLVTVMLQEVEQWPDSGLLLAATNHPELVDPALWRRFDSVLQFDTPNEQAVKSAVERFLGDDLKIFNTWLDTIVASQQGFSLSDVERSINVLRRGHALQTSSVQELIDALVGHDPIKLNKAQRLQLAIELAKKGEHTHLQIHELTGVSRDTIRKHAGPSPRQGRGRKL